MPKKLPLVSSQWLQLAVLVFIAGIVGVGGVRLTRGIHAAATHGILEVTTYDGSIAAGNEIGEVLVVTAPGGSGKNCDPISGTTDATQGANHGQKSFTCLAATGGGPRAYTFSNATRDGYRMSGASPHQPGDTFHISAGAKTSLSIVLTQNDVPPPPPGPDPPPPPPPPPPGATYGVLNAIVTDSGGTPLSGITVYTDHGGSGVTCSPISGITNGQGRVTFTCQAASDGGTRAYRFVNAGGGDYRLSGSSPHQPGDSFHVSAGSNNSFTIIMTRAAPTPASPPVAPPSPPPRTVPGIIAGTPPGPAGSAPGGSGGASAAGHPDSEKTGTVQVTTYVYGANGSRTRLSGVNLHIQSVNHDTTDAADSCSVYNQTTSSSGSPVTGGNYGQVHFTGCWTGIGGSKAYQLSFGQFPAGMTFSDFKITGPSGAKFLSDTTSSSGIDEQFKVLKDQETRLEINLTKTSGNGSNVDQVITQQGIRYVPADTSQAAREAAAALNAAHPQGVAADIDDPETPEDTAAPSTPGHLTAVQDASGSIALSWEAATGNPPGETITYSAQRIIKDSTEDPEPIGDTTTDLTALDDSSNLEYPKTYIYQVIASDDNDNESEPATVEVTTTEIAPNVIADPLSANTGEAAVAAGTSATTTEDSTTISNQDGSASLVIPSGANSEDLACAVSTSDTSGGDSLTDIGAPIGTSYQPVCRNDSGDIVSDFTDEVDLSVSVDDSAVTDDTTLYGFDGIDWVEIPTDDSAGAATADDKAISQNSLGYGSAKKVHNMGSHKTVYTVKTKRLTNLVLVKKYASSHASTLPVVFTFIAILVLGLAARTVVIRRFNLAHVYAPYGDIDLLPLPGPPSPGSNPYLIDPDDQSRGRTGRDE